MTLLEIFEQEETQKKTITPEQLLKIKKGSHRVTDFIIHSIDILFRDPYSFVYRDKPLSYRKNPNPMGYCPFHIQNTFENMLSYAKAYLIGCKYSKETYKRAMEIWLKKKKKSSKKRPEKNDFCYPIAKNTHFFLEIEGLGMFYFQMVYRRKRR